MPRAFSCPPKTSNNISFIFASFGLELHALKSSFINAEIKTEMEAEVRHNLIRSTHDKIP